jgi:hypothetical protein
MSLGEDKPHPIHSAAIGQLLIFFLMNVHDILDLVGLIISASAT